ncbi:hypothetical protein ACWCRF_15720 [Streptomyces sp. NPDC002405]|uniref:hypothetical protein n=1 Tax=unclassified Streptomyces TaxID=2593676 RepID=UPI0036A08A1C
MFEEQSGASTQSKARWAGAFQVTVPAAAVELGVTVVAACAESAALVAPVLIRPVPATRSSPDGF